jgi:TPR repeat protein
VQVRLLVAALLATGPLSGCDGFLHDFWGTRQREAAALSARALAGDQAAFQLLASSGAPGRQPRDAWAAAQLGYVLQVGSPAAARDLASATKAYDWAKGVVPEALHNAALIHLQSGRAGVAEGLLHQAAEGGARRSGLPASMVVLAHLYESGAPSIPRSPSQAAAWFQRAAEAGDPYARRRFAEALLHGTGVAADVPRGVSSLEQAALAGDRGARIALAAAHAVGDFGLQKSRVLAARWLLVAADGSPDVTAAANAHLRSLSPDDRAATVRASQLFMAANRAPADPPTTACRASFRGTRATHPSVAHFCAPAAASWAPPP